MDTVGHCGWVVGTAWSEFWGLGSGGTALLKKKSGVEGKVVREVV